MGFYELAREARLVLTSLKSSPSEEREEEEVKEEIKVWELRLQELGIRVASALIEMEDLEGAARFLGTLDGGKGLKGQKALLWLCLGDAEAARACGGEGVVEALCGMADGEFGGAVGMWEGLLRDVDGEEGERAMWRGNLAVCLLYLGRMDEVCCFLWLLFLDGSRRDC